MKIKTLNIVPDKMIAIAHSSLIRKIRLLPMSIIIIFALSKSSLLATSTVEPWYGPSQQRTDPLYDNATLEKMKVLKISVQWNNVSIAAALQDLTLQSKKADPLHQGIQFTSKLPSEDQKVSLILADATLDDVIGYLSEQANLRVKIHKGEIILLPLKEADKPQ